MGFFTDADKKEEEHANQDQGFFNPNSLDPAFNNAVSEKHFFVSRQGTSVQKTCRNDPDDTKYMICKIKEKKLKNENGEEKYVTEEREERVPVSQQGIFGFNSFNRDFEKNFFSFNKKNKKEEEENLNIKNEEEDPFKEFERSQYFMDFVPKIMNYFKGNGNQENNKYLNRKKELHDPFFEINLMPSWFFTDFGFNDNGFLDDAFFNQPHFHNFKRNFKNNPHQYNKNMHNNTNNYQGRHENQNVNDQNKSNYSYPKYQAFNSNSGDIYDV